MHKSPSGKVYIGIAKDVRHRWRNKGSGYKGSTRISNAIKKYGWDNFEHIILYTDLTREQACEKEIELIAKYDSTNPKNGYNLQSGGNVGIPCEETLKRMSLAQIGHPVSKEVREALKKYRSKSIKCLETGEVYENALQAADILGLCRTSISKCAKGLQDTCGGYHFAYISDIESGKIPRYQKKELPYKKVICETTGEIYENVSDASRKTGVSRRAISYACNGRHQTSGGLKWRFLSAETIQKQPVYTT